MVNSLIEMLEIGKPLLFAGMSANHLMRVCQSELDQSGITADIQCWADPPDANPDLPSKAVYLMRCDGMNEADIEAAKAPIYSAGVSSFTFDPIAWNAGFPAEKQCKHDPTKVLRPSTLKWETMAIDERRMVRMFVRDLRFFLGRAMLLRGLDWVFKCERWPALEDQPSEDKKRPTPVWRVTRLR